MHTIINRQNCVATLLCLAMITLYFSCFVNRAQVNLEIEVAERTYFKIYWPHQNDQYSEKKRILQRVYPGKTNYTFYLTNLKNIDRLRIDPVQYIGDGKLINLTINQNGIKKIILTGSNGFEKLNPNTQVETFAVDQDGLSFTANGKDPYFEYALEVETVPKSTGEWARHISLLLIFTVFIFYTTKSLWPMGGKHKFVSTLLALALLAVIIMAAISIRNAHPDENMHWTAIDYYQDNWLPPVYEDESIRHTYSAYGVSRLNSGEVYYLLAGKFKKVLSELSLPDHMATRGFNLFLMAIIAVMAIKSIPARIMAVPLLITPQVWYTFGYANSDAFAVFITYCCGVQIIDPQSSLNCFLKSGKLASHLKNILLLGLLLGGLFLLKRNFYVFIGFFYTFLGYHIIFNLEKDIRRQAIIRTIILTCIAATLFSARIGMDYYVNGLDKNEKLSVLREEVADVMYRKDSAATGKQHLRTYMKSKGVPFMDIIEKDHWFEKSFRSSFGQYGYLDISATEDYYNLARVLAASFFFFFFGSILLRGGWYGRGTALIVIFFASALIAISLKHSWTDDFQAQGRYLLPIIPMLGILYGICHRKLNTTITTLFISLMFIMSLYSFIFVAIYQVNKI